MENPTLFLIACSTFFAFGFFLAFRLSQFSKRQREGLLKNDISTLMDKVPSPFFVISNREIRYMNQAMKELTNYAESGITIPFDFYSYIPKEQLAEVSAWLDCVQHSESCGELKLKLNLQSKVALWLNLKGAAVVGPAGTSEILVSAFDISEIKKDELMQKRLGDLKDQIILLADSIENHDNIVPLLEKILDIALSKIKTSLFGSFLVLENNEYFEIAAYRGFPPEEIHGAHIPLTKSFAYVASGGNIQKTQIIDDIKELPDSGHNLLSFTGTTSWELRSTLTTPIFLGGELYGSINIDSKEVHAFTEEDAILMEFFRENVEKAIEKTERIIQLKTLSYYDALTGLYNRAYFDEAITEAIYQADRERLPFSVAVIDLDCLKNINDKFGHSSGDMLLKHFSDALKSALPSSSIICRYGGDEFTILFPGSNEAVGQNAMENLVLGLNSRPLRFGDNFIPVSLSFGVSEYDLDARTPISVLERADGKMYEMKWLHKKEALEATEAKKK